ncbi:MAG TPA: phosphoadenylyl-sulfate reductase [Solirubrobacteraceae bacterium]|jgi:phosphoadenosine phosphosulfate reductase|nr:phosphoadenylyl-sulfate reductase [Solirubrobacteraceae bacterium]
MSHPIDLSDELDATLREAGERHGDRLVLLCSFQKEESVLVDAVARVAPRTRLVTIDTGVLFEETLRTWKAFEDRFGVRIEVEDASRPTGAGGPWSGPSDCCGTAKVDALERALIGAEAWVTGIRREQSPTRADAQVSERDERRGIWKYNPLAAWTEKDLWRVIHARDLPYHPLHDAGYASIGCACCTQPGEGRDGRWAGTDKTECGIHVEGPVSGGHVAASDTLHVEPPRVDLGRPA